MTLDGMCDAFHHGPRRAISLGNDQQLEFVLAGPPFSFQLVMFFIIFFWFNNMQRLKCEMWSYFPLSFKERKQNEACCKLLFPFSALCNLILVAPVKCNHINQHLI